MFKKKWKAEGTWGRENNGSEDLDGADPSLLLIRTLSGVSGAVYRRPEAPGFPRKVPAREFLTEGMLMKGGNCGGHNAVQEEEGCIRGETRGGDREPRIGVRGDDRGGARV